MEPTVQNHPVTTGFKIKLTLPLLRRFGIVLAIAAVTVLFSLLNDRFLTWENITDILRSISIITILAIGITFSLTVGDFDLSVGSTASLATIVSAAALVWYRQETVVAIVAALAAGLIVGLFNALLAVRLRIPALLATLATMYIVNGVHLTITKGYSIYNNMPLTDGSIAPGRFLPSFLFIGQGEIGSIPFPVLLMLFVVGFAHVFLSFTRFGRLLYITGSNEEAARLSGVSVTRFKTLAFLLSSGFAALAGIVLASRIGTGQVAAGAPLLMDGVAAALLGCTVSASGKPHALGTFGGSVLMGILLNGLTMLNVPYYAQDVIKGTILAVALSLMHGQKTSG
jgi:simple sugar transport system permease protein